MKVVIDTNVLISGVFFGGMPSRVLETWRDGKIDHGATASLMATFRSGSPDEASDHVAELLEKGIAPQSVIDGLFVGSSELMLRQAGIPALHAVTTTNAIGSPAMSYFETRTSTGKTTPS